MTALRAVPARPQCGFAPPRRAAPRPPRSPVWDALAGVLLLGGAAAWFVVLLVVLGLFPLAA